MSLVTLDFETYYDADYTLTKLSTSEYIRDPRFEAISCSIKIDNKAPWCYFGEEEIKKALAGIDWATAILLAHHTHFDGLILTHHYGHVPKRWADTLSMARALHPKMERNRLEDVAKHYNVTNKLTMPDFKGKRFKDLTADEVKAIRLYNNADVQSCYEAYHCMLVDFPAPELDLIDTTIRMFTEPVLRLDTPKAKIELKREQDFKAAAIEKSGADLDTLSSNPKFVKALEDLGVAVPMKDSPTVRLDDGSPKQIPAVAKSDEQLQALLTHPDPKVAALVEGRLAAKSTISESRALRLLKRGEKKMRIPVYYNYAAAHTHRWSGGDKCNFQNFKQKAKAGGGLRECILAPPGQVLVVVDASQIEARILAWLADEHTILDAFRLGRDIYCEFATEAYHREITKADKEERFVGKTCVLGLGYGMGGIKLQKTLLNQSISQGIDPVRMPVEICYGLVNTYRQKFRNITNLWDMANNQFIGAMLSGREQTYKCLRFEKERVRMPNGLALLYPALDAHIVRTGNAFFRGQPMTEKITDASYLSARSRTKIYGGLFVENLVQALARIHIAGAMHTIAQTRRIVMTTHDEIVFVTAKKSAQKDYEWAVKVMSTPPHWAPDIPLNAEGGFDVSYSK